MRWQDEVESEASLVKHFVTDGSDVEESAWVVSFLERRRKLYTKYEGCSLRCGSCKSSAVLALVSLVVVVVLSIDLAGFASLTWQRGTKSSREVSRGPLEAL